ncbi:MAG: DNA-processing protein DprA [Eubacteriales bacterium]
MPDYEKGIDIKMTIKEMEQLPYYYFLHRVNGIGNRTIRKLLKEFQTPKEIFQVSEERLELFFTKKQMKNWREAKTHGQLMEPYEALKDKKINLYPKGMTGYPKRLLDIPDAPEILYGIGQLPKDEIPTIAMIGARNCSSYGSFVAKKFASKLSLEGVQIISGMARGIDGISQMAAIEGEGKSFAVLGSGVDVCYPVENRKIYEKLKAHGGILSEYIPGTTPLASNFPPRNRIISGLADIILVIEAKEKSGTLITVDMALEQGKEVYVIPGRVTDSLSYGCNKLIKQGAGVVLSVADFLEEIRETYESIYRKQEGVFSRNRNEMQENFSFVHEDEKIIYDMMDFYPKSMDQIAVEVGKIREISFGKLVEILLELCMKNLIMQVSEGQFMRIK